MTCWECDSEGPIHDHHVVPRSKGGQRTIPLCEACHSKVHGKSLRISNLIRSAMAEKASDGLRVSGHPPYGYRHSEDGRRVLHTPELPVIRLARMLRDAGYGYRRIGRVLTELGHTNRRGNPFHHQSVKQIIDSPWREDNAN